MEDKKNIGKMNKEEKLVACTGKGQKRKMNKKKKERKETCLKLRENQKKQQIRTQRKQTLKWKIEGKLVWRRGKKPPRPSNTNKIVRVSVKASPAEGPRRLHTDTAYAHYWGFSRPSTQDATYFGQFLLWPVLVSTLANFYFGQFHFGQFW